MTTGAARSQAAGEPLAFFRGDYVPLSQAQVSVATHALHYGTGVFEGIRGNWNQEQGVVNIFRLREHYERMLLGCRLLLMDLPYSIADLCDITVELVARNGHREDIYIRPQSIRAPNWSPTSNFRIWSATLRC